VDLTKPKETSQNLITTQPSAPVVEDATPQDPTAVPEANAGIVYLAMGIALLLGQFSQHRKSNNKSNNKSNRKSNIKSDIPQQS
jgi:hypothetical protein